MPMRPMHQDHAQLKSRVRDYVLYVAIALAIGAIAVFLGLSNVDKRTANSWLSVGFFTAILFGIFLSVSRSFFHSHSFRMLIAVLLLIHLAVFSVLVTYVAQWRPIWGAVMFLEAPLLDFARTKILGQKRSKRKDERSQSNSVN